MAVLFEYGFIDKEQIVKKLEPIFDKIKLLRTIASIEVLAVNVLSITPNFLQKIDIEKPDLDRPATVGLVIGGDPLPLWPI